MTISSSELLLTIFPIFFFLQKNTFYNHDETKRNVNIFWFCLCCEEYATHARRPLTLKFCVQGYNLFSATLKISRTNNIIETINLELILHQNILAYTTFNFCTKYPVNMLYCISDNIEFFARVDMSFIIRIFRDYCLFFVLRKRISI